VDLRRLIHAARGSALSDPLGAVLGEELQWLATDALEDWLNRIPRGPETRLPTALRHHAGPAARRFHMRAGTLTPRVEASIERLAQGRVVKLSHQPNFAAYCKLFFLMTPLHVIANKLDAAPLYVFNDFDTVGNERFRRVVVPDDSARLGYSYLRLPLAGVHRSHVMFAAPKPDLAWLAQTLEALARALLAAGADERAGAPRAAELMTDLRYAHATAESMTDMCAVLLSRLVNLRLGVPVVFVSGYEVWRDFGLKASTTLLPLWQDVRSVAAQWRARLVDAGAGDIGWPRLPERCVAPYWWICECGSRAILEFASGRTSGFRSRCTRCHRETVTSVGAGVESGRMVPRIEMHNIAISSVFGYTAGIAYASSAPHILLFNRVAASLGMAVLPQLFLDANLGGDAKSRFPEAKSHQVGAFIRDCRVSSMYILACTSAEAIQRALERWMQQFSSGVRLNTGPVRRK
jgi:hypothetical protein